MNGTIQEEDIRRAYLYSNKLREEFSVLLVQKTNEYNVLVEKTNEKLDFEQKDIDKLNNLIPVCETNIQKNQDRINKIPGLIEQDKQDIEDYKEEIERIPETVEYWDDYNERWCVDYYETNRNRERIDNLWHLIYQKEEEIDNLNDEKARRAYYINSLKSMIDDIKRVIDRKNQLIDSIKNKAEENKKAMQDLSRVISNATMVLNKLSSNLSLAAELISNCGKEIGRTSYKNFANHYSPNTTFVLTSMPLQDEIKMLKLVSSTNEDFIKKFHAYNKLVKTEFSSVPTDEAIDYCTKTFKTQYECYESIQQNVKYLTKAYEFLVRYEQINF